MGRMNELSLVEQRAAELHDGYFQCSEQEQEARTLEYTTVLQPALLAAYGEAAPAHTVDPWMADCFSDLYKDRNGFRPRGWSYKAMAQWMENIPPLEDDEEDDRFDPDISGWMADEDSRNPSDVSDDELLRLADFEDVYGVSAMSQAMKHMDMRDY